MPCIYLSKSGLRVMGGGIKVDCSYFYGYHRHNGLEIPRVFGIHDLPQASFKELYSVTWPLYHYRLWQLGKRVLPVKKGLYFERSNFVYDGEVVSRKGDVYFDGYWQNELYFCDCEKIIRTSYLFKNELNERNIKVLDVIEKTNSVSVHIRRGDYVGLKLWENICDIQYYVNAINYVKSRVAHPIFFVFSDDVVWCRKNLSSEVVDEVCYVDWNKEMDSYIDMQLMSKCKHNIVANSSFSWWGAWLNANPDKIVIAPKIWTKSDSRESPVVHSWIRL
jgi:hypothetical protein